LHTDSIFLLPLDHQCTHASLESFGMGAFKGADRDHCRALSAAGDGEWKLVVVSVQGGDNEKGYFMDELYFAPNRDVSEWTERPWLENKVHGQSGGNCDLAFWLPNLVASNFRSFKDGGILLTRGSTKDVWARRESDYYIGQAFGNEGVDKTTSYQSYFLLAWSQSCELELKRRRENDRAQMVESCFDVANQLSSEFREVDLKHFDEAFKQLFDSSPTEILSLPPEQVEDWLDSIESSIKDPTVVLDFDDDNLLKAFWKRWIVGGT